MSMTTEDLVTLYKGERSDAKLGQQLFAIPRREDMIDSQVFYYYVGDRRRVAVDFTKQLCFHLKFLKLKSMTPAQYRRVQESTTPMEDLITAELIQPFAVFLYGRFIPWENITIIASNNRYDMLIHDLSAEFFALVSADGGMCRDFSTIMLPDSIQYKEGGFTVSENTLFAFDTLGKLVTSGTANIVIDNYEDNVKVNDFTNITTDAFIVDNTLKYKYFSQNVCVFLDNTYDPTATVSVLGAAIRIYNGTLPEGKTITVRVFHNTKLVTTTYDNVAKFNLSAVQDALIRCLQRRSPPAYIDKVRGSFDPSTSTSDSYAVNISKNLNYYAQYDHGLFNKVYKTNKFFVDMEVTGQWVLDHTDDVGYLKLPRQFQNDTEYYIMVIHNGYLYEYYKHHFYQEGWFYCPVYGIEAADTVELFYFKNCKNFEIPAVINSDDTYQKLDETIYGSDLRIFCKESEDPMFEFPEEGIQHFPVAYSYEYDPTDSSKKRIRYDSEFYYGKDVTLASSRRFKYFIFNIESPTGRPYFTVDFGEELQYCNEYDNFIVFYNGKRLINDMYRLILPYRDTTPFTKSMIYLCMPLYDGDRIEVFYIPHHFVDIYDEPTSPSVPDNGIITVDKAKLSFALDTELYSVWVNAKKIPPSQIKNISSNKLQITGVLTSKLDLRITTMIDDEDVYAEFKSRFHTFTSAWDDSMNVAENPSTILGYSAPTFPSYDPEAFPTIIPTAAIMNEIIRDWYIANAIVDTTEPFYYGYQDVDESIKGGPDSGGHMTLEVMDSNKQNSLDVDRPWP